MANILLLVPFLAASIAKPGLPAEHVPEPLKNWVKWVEYQHPDLYCPGECVTYGQLFMRIDNKKASFTIEGFNWSNEPQRIELPGNPEYGKMKLLQHSYAPHVSGDSWYTTISGKAFSIKGELLFSSIPQEITIPQQYPLMDITYLGRKVYPSKQQPQLVVLQKEKQATIQKDASAEKTPPRIIVRRWIQLDRPTTLVNKFVVTCNMREQDVYIAIPPSSMVEYVKTKAPLYPTQQVGQFQYRCPIGKSEIEIHGRLSLNATAMAVPKLHKDSTQEDEVWVFSPKPLRWQTKVTGGTQIEASLVQELDQSWLTSMATVWRMIPDSQLTWTKDPIHKGKKDSGSFKVTRNVVATDNPRYNFFITDAITVDTGSETEITLENSKLNLQGLSKEGDNDLILAGNNKKPSIQIRQRHVQVGATMWWNTPFSHFLPTVQKIPHGGWSVTFDSGDIHVRLLPGFVPLFAWGAESHSGDLLRRLNLYDLLLAVLAFVLAFLAVTRGRNENKKLAWFSGVMAALVTVFSPWIEPYFILPVWILLLVFLTAYRLVTLLKERYARATKVISIILIVFSVIWSLILIAQWPDLVRVALHPQLERGPYNMLGNYRYASEYDGDVTSDEYRSGQPRQAPPPPRAALATKKRKSKGSYGSNEMEKQQIQQEMAVLAEERAGSGDYKRDSREGKLGRLSNTISKSSIAGLPGYGYQQQAQTNFQTKMIKPVGISGSHVATGAHIQWKFDSPLPEGRDCKVMVLPPWMRSLGLFAHLALVVIVTLFMLGVRIRKMIGLLPVRSSVILLVLLPGVLHAGQQKMVTPEMLEDLAQQLKPKACQADCASFHNMQVILDQNQKFTIKTTVSSVDTRLVAMPGPWYSWQIDSAKIDGKQLTGYRLSGNVKLLIPAGVHVLELQGMFEADENPRILFKVPVSGFIVQAKNWRADLETKQRTFLPAGKVIPLLRQAQMQSNKKQSEITVSIPLQPRIQIYRHITINQQHTMQTTVQANGLNVGQAVDIPILSGESVEQYTELIKDNTIRFTAGGSYLNATYASSFKTDKPIKLVASKNNHIIETWDIFCDYTKSCQTDVTPQPSNQPMPLHYEPQPNDAVLLTIMSLEALPGNTAEGLDWHLVVNAGVTSSTYQLSGKVKMATSNTWELALPTQSKVKELKIDGNTHPARPEKDVLKVQLGQGVTSFSIQFIVPHGLQMHYRLKPFHTNIMLTNFKSEIRTLHNRVVLATLGSIVHGPTTLFWSVAFAHIILAILVFAFAKKFLPQLPHNIWQWLILLVPLASLSTAYVPFLVFPLFLMAKPLQSKAKPRWGMIILLVFAIVVEMITIIGAAGQALLDSPNMHLISRVSSQTYTDLAWLQGTVAANQVPSLVGTVSIPLWIWQFIQFFWCLWLLWLIRKWFPVIKERFNECLKTITAPKEQEEKQG